MPIAWHPERWWNCCKSKDEEKEKDRFLLRGCKSVCRKYTILGFKCLNQFRIKIILEDLV